MKKDIFLKKSINLVLVTCRNKLPRKANSKVFNEALIKSFIFKKAFYGFFFFFFACFFFFQLLFFFDESNNCLFFIC